MKHIVWNLICIVFVNTLLLAHSNLQEKLDKKYTTSIQHKTLFMQQLSGLSDEEQDKAMLGFSFYRTPWVEAPAATSARDGLGPLFSANTCLSCHPNNAQGSVHSKEGDSSRAYVLRLSIPSSNSPTDKRLTYTGFIPEPTYGSQLSIHGTGSVPFEGKVNIRYEKKKIVYPDGRTILLSKPKEDIDNVIGSLNYGKLHKDVILSRRLAPALVGLGLLEQISDADILAQEDVNDRNHDGISGKANMVYSPKFQEFRVGRYTWKASAPSVLHQVASAAYNDMSLTNPLFPKENCTKEQKICLNAPKGDEKRAGSPFDLPMKRLEAIAFYLQNLKIPKSLISEKEGEKLFISLSCAKCHTPAYTLANGYVIKPFTDLLLHDMGEALSDGRSEFKATALEWRTAPLWSIGKYKLATGKEPELLHDGRAKSIEEAILWHGGEAKRSRDSFMSLSLPQRETLLRYINEL